MRSSRRVSATKLRAAASSGQLRLRMSSDVVSYSATAASTDYGQQLMYKPSRQGLPRGSPRQCDAMNAPTGSWSLRTRHPHGTSAMVATRSNSSSRAMSSSNARSSAANASDAAVWYCRSNSVRGATTELDADRLRQLVREQSADIFASNRSCAAIACLAMSWRKPFGSSVDGLRWALRTTRAVVFSPYSSRQRWMRSCSEIDFARAYDTVRVVGLSGTRCEHETWTGGKPRTLGPENERRAMVLRPCAIEPQSHSRCAC